MIDLDLVIQFLKGWTCREIHKITFIQQAGIFIRLYYVEYMVINMYICALTSAQLSIN